MGRWIVAGIVTVVFGCGDPNPPPRSGSHLAGPSTAAVPAVQREKVVTFTDAALEKLRSLRQADKPYVRVQVVGGGATGFIYDMKFDDRLNAKNDLVDEAGGITTVVDKKSALYLEGSKIDWRTAPDGKQGFHFDNPNAVKK